MRVAGIQAGARMIWADAGNYALGPLDSVVVRTAEGDVAGEVLVTPEQLLSGAPPTTGNVVQVTPRHVVQTSCADLPGADMPALGSAFRKGVVTAVDAVNRTVTVRDAEGKETEQPYELNGPTSGSTV